MRDPSQGEIRFDESLAPYTSWHIGGKAKRYYRPTNIKELSNFLQSIPSDENLLWLGLGSNVLIRDGGFNGTVLHTIKLQEGTEYYSAGLTCAKLAKIIAKNGLAGAEFFAGIPGTLGGALAMNAGAWGGQTWDFVEFVETIDRHGTIRKRDKSDYKVGYRTVSGPDNEWFIAAKMNFPVGDSAAATLKIKDLLRIRAEKQPIGVLSCGSVFKNPPGKYAAELIEASKLKGTRVGNAEVSSKHANFIVNLGNALAADIEVLIARVQKKVLLDHGVKLQTEVRIVGEKL